MHSEWFNALSLVIWQNYGIRSSLSLRFFYELLPERDCVASRVERDVDSKFQMVLFATMSWTAVLVFASVSLRRILIKLVKKGFYRGNLNVIFIAN